jgi:hypothetical protein
MMRWECRIGAEVVQLLHEPMICAHVAPPDRQQQPFWTFGVGYAVAYVPLRVGPLIVTLLTMFCACGKMLCGVALCINLE